MNQKQTCYKFRTFPGYAWISKGGYDCMQHPLDRLAFCLRPLPIFSNAKKQLCDELGCFNPGEPCFLIDDDYDHPSFFYCAKHKFTNGFCVICGQFWSGIELFDFGPGWCENCAEDDDDFDCEDDEWDLEWEFLHEDDLI